MNYFNALTELETINTTQLSEKGSQQVQDFQDFVTPLIPDIRNGEAAKAKIAEYYLEHKNQYTEGCVKVLEPLVNQLGVSAGYISQIKKAKEYKDSIQDTSLEQWVDEHPISIQYHIAKAPHEKVMEKFMTGEHCSKREAESFTRVKSEVKIKPGLEPASSEYQLKVEKAKVLVEDNIWPILDAIYPPTPLGV